MTDILAGMSHATSTGNRVERFSKILQSRGVDAYFCTSAVTMGYLSGFHEEGGERLLFLGVSKDGRSRLVAPALARTQAERSGIADIRSWRDGENAMDCVRELFADWGFKTVAVDDEMRAATLIDLQDTLPNVTFIAGQPVLSDLVRCKDHNELASLREAGRIADEAYAPLIKSIRPGMTEWQIHELLTKHMQEGGAKPNFCIVGAGPNSAEPHHMTGDTVINDGDMIVMDYGCVIDGYMSDITRMVFVGNPSDEHKKVYEVVYAAHMAGRKAIAPGVLAEDIDRATRKVIDDAGYGEFFVHRTGHGLGMRIHEEPYICAGNKHRLEVGNVFSIEPGIYLPGKFGVRIENIVAVTESGHESMNAEPSSTLQTAG